MNEKSKKVTKRIVVVIVSLIVLPFLAYGIFYLAVPISRPDDAVHSYVLRKMPIGTSWDDAIVKISNQNWGLESTHDCGLVVSKITGFVRYPHDNEEESPDLYFIGTKSMYIYLGEYYNPWNVSVCAYLAFDENGKLIEAFIRKDYDSI